MKVENLVEYSFLLDFYGAMLTSNQREILSLYMNDNLGFSEIAEIKGISRQAVSDNVNKAKTNLTNLEEKLKFYGKFNKIIKFAEKKLSREDIEKLKKLI